MEDRKSVVEFKPHEKAPVSIAGVVGSILGGSGLALAASNAVSSLVSRYAGGNGTNITTPTPVVVSPTPVGLSAAIPTAPAVDMSFVPAAAGMVINALHNKRSNCDYVTEKEMVLIREIMDGKSENSQLKAEKYADSKVVDAVEKVTAKYDAALAVLNNKVCNLETHAAVTSTSFEDYKQFSNRLFVHQPKAKMKDCIVTTTDDCCCTCGSAPAI